jgi:uncharacterized membrane protein YeiH
MVTLTQMEDASCIIIDYLKLIGVAAFAISGATIAIKKRMDLFGILFLLQQPQSAAA